MQEFEIKGRLANLNDYQYACRSHYMAGNKMKKQEQSKVKQAIICSNLKPIKEYPIKIRYYFYEENRKRDLDNVAAMAHKFIQDSLVDMEILENDGWKQIKGFEDTFGIDKENPRIIVQIFESGEF